MAAETSPVNAPHAWLEQSWPPQPIDVACSVAATSPRYGAGTHTATSAANGSAPFKAFSNAALATRLPFILQLPTTSLERRGDPELAPTTRAPACRCGGSTPSTHGPAPPRRPGTLGGSPA